MTIYKYLFCFCILWLVFCSCQESSGEIQFAGGTYNGQLQNGTPNGQGKLSHPDYTYEGNWINGNKTGKGSYQNIAKTIYSGNWKNDKFDGQGKLSWKTPNSASEILFPAAYMGGTYEGAFSSDVPEGKGKIEWEDSTKYKGDFKNGSRHGNGIWYWADNSSYEGEWENDKLLPGKLKWTTKEGTAIDAELVSLEQQFSYKPKPNMAQAPLLMKGTEKPIFLGILYYALPSPSKD